MKNILVVEDDQFLSNAYKLKLTKSGFETRIASDGNEALEILKEFTPNLILLDLIMPNLDGFGTLEILNADPNLKKIPVIVASNLGQKEDIQKAKELGAKDFIIKSNVSIEEIVQRINSAIG